MTLENQHFRIHVAGGEPITRSGGLHNYVLGLASGQLELGLKPVVIHDVKSANRFELFDRFGSELPSASEDDIVMEFHFAQTARRALKSPKLRQLSANKIFHFHGPWYAEGRVQGNSWLRSRAKYALESLQYQRFNRFVTASAAFRALLVEDFRIPEEQIGVIYPGVDTSRFTPGSKEAAREILGLPHDGVIAVCVRRLEPRMGLRHAIEAIARTEGVFLAIAGKGSLRKELERYCADLGVSFRVKFLERVSDELLPMVYRAGDVSLVPTIAFEGFGLIVRESIACGTPVIASNLGGLPEAMGPFSDWLVPPGDVGALTSKIHEICEGFGPSPSVLSAFAGSFTLAGMASELEEVLSLPSRHGEPPEKGDR